MVAQRRSKYYEDQVRWLESDEGRKSAHLGMMPFMRGDKRCVESMRARAATQRVVDAVGSRGRGEATQGIVSAIVVTAA